MGLDRQVELAIPLVDIGDPRIDPVANRITVGTLLAAFAGQIASADKAGQTARDRNLKPTVTDSGNRTGNRVTLGDAVHDGCIGIVRELLDAKADPLFIDVNVENAGLDHLAFLVLLDGFFAIVLPRQVRQMHHPVDIPGQTDEQTEFGDVLDLAFDFLPGREVRREGIPGVVVALLEAKADPSLLRIDFEHHDVDFLAGRYDFARMHVLLCPAHLGNMDQAFDAGFQFHKRTVIGDVADTAGILGADRVFQLHAFPRIRIELLHTERNTLGFGIVANDLNLDGLANRQSFGRMVDATPRDIGDMQQTIDTAEIDERAVIGDVLDHAFENLAFLEVGEKLVALLGPGFFQNGAARNHYIAAASIHFEDLERLRRAHERADITDRTDIDLAAGQECDGAGKIDRKAAFDAAEDCAADTFGFLKRDFQKSPCLFTAGALTAEDSLTVLVFHPLQIDVDDIADLDLRGLARHAEFLERNAPFGFQTDLDQYVIAVDRKNRSLDDGTFCQVAVAKAFLQQGSEVFFETSVRHICHICSHNVS